MVGFLFLAILKSEGLQRRGRKIDFSGRKGFGGPANAKARRRPNLKEDTSIWEGKPPFLEKRARRYAYNLNKKLIDDLR